MSKEQIVEYVMNTPGNTNRTILGQMIDSEGKDTLEIAKEMDAVTLAMAKKYADDQRLAWVDTEDVTLTFDGNIDAAEATDAGEGNYLVKVSSECFDLSTVKKLEVSIGTLEDGIIHTEESGPDGFVLNTEDGLTSLNDAVNGGMYVVVLTTTVSDGDSVVGPGTYFRYSTDEVSGFLCVSAMTVQKETVHKIDPKFLPGVCLPLVELTTPIEGEETNLTEDDTANMEALNGEPCILRWHLAFEEGYTETGIAAVSRTRDGFAYSAYSYIGEARFMVAGSNGQWVAKFV